MSRLKRWTLAAALLFAAGCSSGTPKAVTPETSVNFGNVPVVTSMAEAKVKEFVILNEGSAPLKLTGLQVKTLEGC